MSENSTGDVTEAPVAPRPIIQLLGNDDGAEADGCCGGGSCGI